MPELVHLFPLDVTGQEEGLSISFVMGYILLALIAYSPIFSSILYNGHISQVQNQDKLNGYSSSWLKKFHLIKCFFKNDWLVNRLILHFSWQSVIKQTIKSIGEPATMDGLWRTAGSLEFNQGHSHHSFMEPGVTLFEWEVCAGGGGAFHVVHYS